MPDLVFQVEGAEPVLYSAVPLLALRLLVENRPLENRAVESTEPEEIRSVTLQCQIRIETARRSYNHAEQRRLLDLFGEPARWSQTLHSMLWTLAAVVIPPFRGTTVVDLPVPCTFDLTVATAKFFNGLEGGSVPLTLLFSGTVFYASEDGALQVTQIPWSKEASYALPATVWKKMMDVHYPNTAWLELRRDVFERLHQYKIDRGIPTWEQTLEGMLP